MAALDFAKVGAGRLSQPPNTHDRSRTAREHQSTWQRTALEIAGTFLVLMGIAVGILSLRLVLVLTHGVLH